MGRRRTVHRDLPPHMKRSGAAYYYDHGVVNGKRTYTPLGHDLPLALRKWAELEGTTELRGTTFGDAARRYRREVLRTKAPKTQSSYVAALDVLEGVFGAMALDKITPEITADYLRRRSVVKTKDGKRRGGPTIAAREMAVLSLVFNCARDWGYTAAANPRYGKRLPKSHRNTYITDEVYAAIYEHADELLRDAMDLAYLIGQRPTDVLTIRRDQIRDGRLEIQPGKTAKSSGARVAIEIVGELATVIERIKARPRKITSVLLLQRPDGSAVTLQMIQRRWQTARAAAGVPMAAAQFRDLRAKAATDLDDLAHAQRLLAHSARGTTEGYVRGRVGEKVRPVSRKLGGNSQK